MRVSIVKSFICIHSEWKNFFLVSGEFNEDLGEHSRLALLWMRKATDCQKQNIVILTKPWENVQFWCFYYNKHSFVIRICCYLVPVCRILFLQKVVKRCTVPCLISYLGLNCSFKFSWIRTQSLYRTSRAFLIM